MSTSDPTSTTTSTDVAADAHRAFHVFTAEMGSWWDERHHIGSVTLAEMVFETHVGGHVIDRGIDGSECRWARVLVYDPPRRVRFSWDITPTWELETDPARCSEVEITFAETSPRRTTVTLTHLHLDRHGEGWRGLHDTVGSGWDLTRLARAADGVPAREGR